MENLHDINQLFDDKELNLNQKKKSQKKTNLQDEVDIIVNGKILSINDIKDLPVQKWPKITNKHINKGEVITFILTVLKKKISFLTTKNFTTQFGREVVYNLVIKKDKNFQKIDLNLKKNFPYLDVWRWQNFKFERNILLTMKKMSEGFIKEQKIQKKIFEI